MNKSTLELLESRIAPAALLASGKGITYTDTDGDQVTVTVSKGQLSAADFTFNNNFATTGPQQLQLINLGDDVQEFAHANLTFAVKAGPHGDGMAHVGFINAKGVDLGTVTVKGDLGRIEAGDDNATAPGATAVKVQSLGVMGLSTQAAGGSLRSFFVGGVGSLTVAGDVDGAEVNAIQAGAVLAPKIGALTIGGSLLGHDNPYSGQIYCAGDIGSVKIGHDVRGGDGAASGQIAAGGKITSVLIGGGLFGGSHNANTSLDVCGAIISGASAGGHGDVQSITIGDSLIGGSGYQSGHIFVGLKSPGGLGSLVIGDDLRGGTGNNTGSISVESKLGSLRIGGDVRGGSTDYSGYVSLNALGTGKIVGSVIGGDGEGSGLLRLGSPTSFTVGGSITGGEGANSGQVLLDSPGAFTVGGSIHGGDGIGSGKLSASKITSLAVKGSLIGGGAGNAYGINVAGSAGSISIGGDIRPSEAGASYQSGVFVIGSLGSMKIGGSVLGAENAGFFPVFSANQVGSLQVKGEVIGTAASPVKFNIAGSGGGAGLELGSFSVGGRFDHALINGGLGIYDGVEFGKITIGGDFIASRIVASATPGNDAVAGTLDDGFVDKGLASRIASVIINGQARGTVGGTDSFGILADIITQVRVHGIEVHPAPATTTTIGSTGDVFLRSPA